MKDPYVRGFISELEAQGRPQGSIRTYKWALKYFINFCRTREISPLRARTRDLKEFRNWLISLPNPRGKNKERRSPRTINLIISTTLSFLRWLAEEGKREGVPHPRTVRVREEEPDVSPLSPEEEKALLSYVEERASRRFRLAVKLMLSTGLRVGEVATLKWGDLKKTPIPGGGSVVKVRVRQEKSGEVRYVPITDLALAEELWKERSLHDPEEPIVGMKASSIKVQFTRLHKRTGLKIHSHRLRHTFATRALELGVPLDVVQRLLGHKKIETTRRYAKTTDERVDAFLPKLLRSESPHLP